MLTPLRYDCHIWFRRPSRPPPAPIKRHRSRGKEGASPFTAEYTTSANSPRSRRAAEAVFPFHRSNSYHRFRQTNPITPSPVMMLNQRGNPMGNLSGVVRQLGKERARLENELHRVTAALAAFGKVYFSGAKPKRTMSVAGRKRVAAAQRARWAKQKAGSKPATPKRTMSAAARRKIAAAQRKRWAKIRATKAV